MKYLAFCVLFASIINGCNPNHFVFTQNVEAKTLIDTCTYAACVENLPICCVDVFIYNTKNKAYLLVERRMPPAQGEFYFPGGRLFKGESFFECARRKCKEEIGLEVSPQAIIDVYSTIFPDSAWNCQTHTINIAIFATCDFDENTMLNVNNEQGAYAWYPIAQAPENIYLNGVYKQACALLDRE